MTLSVYSYEQRAGELHTKIWGCGPVSKNRPVLGTVLLSVLL